MEYADLQNGYLMCILLSILYICLTHFFRDIQKATQNFTTILEQGSFGLYTNP
uniref:Uncharacterized protein n=1 Tax=Rhizophora mucronata TaxID=61149 RepID=A0A2P2MU51_RHIMU